MAARKTATRSTVNNPAPNITAIAKQSAKSATTKVAPKKKQDTRTLTLEQVKKLGETLLRIGDRYPLLCRTETDFYPLVGAFLDQHFPGLEEEATVEKGEIDFKIAKTTNPAYLELAVTPRQLVDYAQSTAQPKAATALYGPLNKTELVKLSNLTQAKAKGRYLLLIDLQKKPHDFDKLKKSYEKLKSEMGTNIVNVVYVCRGQKPHTFSLAKPKTPPSTAQPT